MMDEPEILDIPLPDDNSFTAFILHYKQLMTLYESAIRCVAMRLSIMEKEADTNGKHNPIRSISSRIKQPLSINRKLRSRGVPLTDIDKTTKPCGAADNISNQILDTTAIVV